MSVNRLKSIFVAAYLVVVVLVAVGSLAGLLLSGARLVWAGALLSVMPFAGLFLWTTRSRSLARTSPHLPVSAALTLAGGTVAVYGFWQSEYTAIFPMICAALGVIGFFLFDFWYSHFGRRINEGKAPTKS